MNPLIQFKKILTLPSFTPALNAVRAKRTTSSVTIKRSLPYSLVAASSTLLCVASYGQTPIASVPFTITTSGNYIITAELIYSTGTGNAITVNASNVTIDLNGHYLRCSAANNSARGIAATNKSDIRVRNGEIIGFSHGVLLNWVYPQPEIVNSGHVIDSVVFRNCNYGVWFHQTFASVVRNCIFIGNNLLLHGWGVYFYAGSGNRAANNVASGLNTGFYSDGKNYFDSNYADSCTVGFDWGGQFNKLRFNTTTNCVTGVAPGGFTSEFANDQ